LGGARQLGRLVIIRADAEPAMGATSGQRHYHRGYRQCFPHVSPFQDAIPLVWKHGHAVVVPRVARGDRVLRQAEEDVSGCPRNRERARLKMKRPGRPVVAWPPFIGHRNHASPRPVPKAWPEHREGSTMTKVLAIFALLIGLTACHVGGGFSIGANDHQPTRVASAE